jgi:hypothetical protein
MASEYLRGFVEGFPVGFMAAMALVAIFLWWCLHD